MPAAGQRIGSIRITLYAAEYELALLQPGSVSGRDPRSDWIALEDGRVMSVAAATAELAKTITKRMTKRERSAL